MHLTTDQLADLAAGTLTSAETAPLLEHVSSCPPCSDALAAVHGAAGLLGEVLPSAEPMPAAVSARLEIAIAAEAQRRASGRAAEDKRTRQREHAERLATGSFANEPTRRRTGFDVPA